MHTGFLIDRIWSIPKIQEKTVGFPHKVDYLNEVGVFSPNISKKINQKRNLLEHEYSNPTKEEIDRFSLKKSSRLLPIG